MITADIYTKNQVEKLGNAIIFLCNKISPLSKTHVLKLIFIIEEFSIKKFGIPFFDLKFDMWKLGPVSKDLFVELTEEPNLLADYILRESRDEFLIIKAKKEFSDDEFNDNELLLLNEIAERFQDCTAKELINFTHRKGTIWYNTALRNGLLEDLENGKINTTNIELDLKEIIIGDSYKLSIYNSYKEFINQSKILKG